MQSCSDHDFALSTFAVVNVANGEKAFKTIHMVLNFNVHMYKMSSFPDLREIHYFSFKPTRCDRIQVYFAPFGQDK